MNLLFVAYNIVQSEGGEIPLRTLVNKINSGRQFRKPDDSALAEDELKDLIQNHGHNIKVDFDDIVRTFYVSERPISILFWNILETLRFSPVQPESIGITILFYARVSSAPEHYIPLKHLRLQPLDYLVELKRPKTAFVEEFEKLGRHELFPGKLSTVIAAINNIDEDLLRDIMLKIVAYDISEKSISPNDFAQQFQDLFLNISSLSRDFLLMPEFIREIICRHIIDKPVRNVYTPVLGLGEVFASLNLISRNSSIRFYGETNFDSYGFAAMNLILHRLPNFNISLTNPLVKSEVSPQSIDCIICQPPFGGQSSINDWQLESLYLRFGRSSRLEILYLQFVLNTLSTTGKAYIILPEGFLFSENLTEKRIRQYLIENDFLESVISFPAGVYDNSRIKTNLLIIDKDKVKNKRGKVLFFDTFSIWVTLFDKALITDIAHNTAKQLIDGVSHELVRENISNEEIAQNNYRLQVPLYVNSYSKKLRNLLAHNENIAQISDVVSDIKFKGISALSSFPYIKGGDLSKDPSDPFLKIKQHDDVLSRVNGKIVDCTSVLVARIGSALNPTIFRYTEQPVVVNQNVYILPVNENFIDIEYFALELSSELVKEQVKGILTGTAMQYYNYQDLLKIKIRLPSLEDQKKHVLRANDQILAAKKKELGLLADKLSSQEDEIKVLSAMKHSFAQLPFKSDLDNIQTYLNNKISVGQNISWNDPISPSLNSRTVKEVFEGINKMIDSTNELFQNMENLINCDPNKMEIENVKIHDFIKEVLAGIKELEGIDIAVDGMNIPVRIDKYQFKELITNFAMNAVKHAFEGVRFPKALFFHTEIAEGFWILTVTNNGAPFPTDFSVNEFISFGKRAKASNGTGVGGYIIDKVVKNHEGKLTINDKRKYAEEEMNKYRELSKNSKVNYFPLIWTVEFVMKFPFNFNSNA
jgi:signal transduction histidine kinase